MRRNIASGRSSGADSRSSTEPTSAQAEFKPERKWSIQDSIAHASLFPFYERRILRVYRADLGRLATAAAPEPAGFEFRILRPDDPVLIPQVERYGEAFLGNVRARIAREAFCLAAVCEDRVVGFNLIGFGRVFLPAVYATQKCRPDAAWSELIYVRSDIRRGGLGSCLRLRSFAELRRRGIRKLYGGTLAHDEAALGFARATGFVEVAEIEYLRLFEGHTWRYRRVMRSDRTNPSAPFLEEGKIAGRAPR